MHRVFLPLVLLVTATTALVLLLAPEGNAPTPDTPLPAASGPTSPGATPMAAPLTATTEAVAAPPTLDARGGWTVSGRVLGKGRRPIAGARVSARRNAGNVATATTGADGHYRFDLARAALGQGDAVLLVARAEGARGATVGVRLPSAGGRLAAPPLILRQTVAFAVRVTAAGKPVAGAQVALARRAAGRMQVELRGETDATGRLATGPGLAPGEVHVFAMAAGWGRTHRTARIEQEGADGVEIALPARCALRVRVRDEATQMPLRGADIGVGTADSMPRPLGPGLLPTRLHTRTGPGGQVTLHGLGTGEQVLVRVSAPGHTPKVRTIDLTVAGAEATSTLDVNLKASRNVRFEIVPADVGLPATGVPLQVVFTDGGKATLIRAVVTEEGLFVEGLPTDAVQGSVIGPEGTYALFSAGPDETRGPPVSFAAPRRVRVRLVGSDGEGVPGIALRCDPLGSGEAPAPETTDENGEASFAGVSSDRAAIHLTTPARSGAGAMLRRLDLLLPEDPYELSLGPRFSLQVETRIDGEARLPTSYTLRLDGHVVSPATIEEDPDEGRLHLAARLPAQAATPAQVRIEAAGYRPVSHALTGGGGTVTLELERAGVITAQVAAPADGHMRLALRRRDEESGFWRRVERVAGLATAQRTGSEHAFRFEGLAPGRYRLEDRATQVRSAEVRLDERRERAEITLDLRAALWVTGRVSGPAGADLAKARVLWEGRAVEAEAYEGARVHADGSFRVRGLRGRRLVLSVVHPLLEADPVGGRARVRAGGGPVTLTLRSGASATFRLARAAPAGRERALGRVRVQLVRADDPADAPPVVIEPVATADGYHFGGFAPGRYALLVSMGKGWTPVRREGVVLSAGETDLGTLPAAVR